MSNYNGRLIKGGNVINKLKAYKDHMMAAIFLIVGIWIGISIISFNIIYTDSYRNQNKIKGLKDDEYSRFNIFSNRKFSDIEVKLKENYLDRNFYLISKKIGGENSSYTVQGVSIGNSKYKPELKGRFFNANDIEKNLNVAIIGSKLKDKTYKKNGLEYIAIKDTNYEVIGTTDSSIFMKSVIIPINKFLETNNDRSLSDFDWMFLEKSFPTGAFSDILLSNIDSGYIITDEKKCEGMPNSSVFLIIISIATLAVGIINIINFTRMWIEERRHEIALRKVVGATNLMIRRMLFRDFLTLVFAAFVLSLLTNGIITYVINKLYILEFHLNFSVTSIALSSLIALGISIITAIPSYKQATNIEPAIILKEE